MNPQTYFIGNQQKKKVGVVLGLNLDQIRSNVVKKVRKVALSIGLFSYFAWGIPFKTKNRECTNI